MPRTRVPELILAMAMTAATTACSRPEPAAVEPAAKVQAAAVAPVPKSSPSFMRDHYARLDDCVYDWGVAQKCTPAPSASSSGTTAYVGPIYAKNYREETQVHLRKEAADGGYSAQLVTEASDRSIGTSEVKPQASQR